MFTGGSHQCFPLTLPAAALLGGSRARSIESHGVGRALGPASLRTSPRSVRPTGDGRLLLADGHLQPLFRADQMVVVVLAEVDLNPVHRSVEHTLLGRVVVGANRAAGRRRLVLGAVQGEVPLGGGACRVGRPGRGVWRAAW